MGCGCGSSSNQEVGSSNVFLSNSVQSNEPCDILQSNIVTWQNILKCVKTSGKLALIGLSEFNVNQYLGIIQSALNYPDNYCLYKPQLDYIKDTILPNIIENVTECIN